MNLWGGNQKDNTDGLVQDRSISSALAMETLQSCTNPSMCHTIKGFHTMQLQY